MLCLGKFLSILIKVTVIGGGASGFFAAISAKGHFPNAQVTIIEKSNKLRSKVKVSGGGRCNVTHACFSNSELLNSIPEVPSNSLKYLNSLRL